MTVSVFDLFRVGIGPSSSHTVGPMRAARFFVRDLTAAGVRPERLIVELYGSLAATGRGHGTDKAVIAGLSGCDPAVADPSSIDRVCEGVRQSATIDCPGFGPLIFHEADDLKFIRRALPHHANAVRFVAAAADGGELLSRTYYSVGGGFVVSEDDIGKPAVERPEPPLAFHSGRQLLELCREQGRSISEIVRVNELSGHTSDELRDGIAAVWQAMQDCVSRGCNAAGEMPGGLHVRRRAAALYAQLTAGADAAARGIEAMDWLNLWALAVNEENASGGRVVTAPTNGAAGIVPAVLMYYHRFCHEGRGGATAAATERFFLTATAIGILFKENASISGAEVGCQGEVGSACSMAAAGLAEVLGGTPEQVENAAEIGMEHHLGLTCDPIGGLVQIPCIERNAVAAVTAVNAARLALRGDGRHYVSLDKVIRTMKATGADMRTKYKETSRGGLAVNLVEC